MASFYGIGGESEDRGTSWRQGADGAFLGQHEIGFQEVLMHTCSWNVVVLLFWTAFVDAKSGWLLSLRQSFMT